VSNGGTEAINLIIEKTRRLAHGFRTFDHYRLRILLAASGTRPGRSTTHRRAGLPELEDEGAGLVTSQRAVTSSVCIRTEAVISSAAGVGRASCDLHKR
jgi:hypothetical protein